MAQPILITAVNAVVYIGDMILSTRRCTLQVQSNLETFVVIGALTSAECKHGNTESLPY